MRDHRDSFYFKKHAHRAGGARPMSGILWIVFLAGLCNTFGQTLFKKSADTFELPHVRSFGVFIRFFGQVFSSPWIWLGLSAMGLGLFVWFFAISRGDLSLVYPIGSMQYVMILISARIILKEKIHPLKVLGTVFIVFGILLITKS
jgi:multidrug transporter EmrE-like cation transporter